MARKDELIKELANKYHVSPEEVEKAVNSQFKFTRKKMASGKFPEIRIPYFGLFRAKESRIKHLNKAKKHNEQQEKEQQEHESSE